MDRATACKTGVGRRKLFDETSTTLHLSSTREQQDNVVHFHRVESSFARHTESNNVRTEVLILQTVILNTRSTLNMLLHDLQLHQHQK